MSHGKLLALDTPFNIKKRFGVGYNLFVEPKSHFVSQFQSIKGQIDDVMRNESIISNVTESNDSTPKRLIYLLPFDQVSNIPNLLRQLEQSFPDLYVDIEMNSLEDAYVNIAKAEERLHSQSNSPDRSQEESELSNLDD